MKLPAYLSLATLLAFADVQAQRQDLLINLVGNMMNQAMRDPRQSDRPYNPRYPSGSRGDSRREYDPSDYEQPSDDTPPVRYNPTTTYRSKSEQKRSSSYNSPAKAWTVVTINGASVAADPNGLSISHDRTGAIYLSLTPRAQLPQNVTTTTVNFVFDGQFFGSFPGKAQNSSIIVDDQIAIPLLLSNFKVKRNYQIVSTNVEINGSLSGSSNALDQIEQAARIAGAVYNSSNPGNVTVSSTVISADSVSVAALSEADKLTLEQTADSVANLTAQIEILSKVLESQKQLAAAGAALENKSTIEATIRIINDNMETKRQALKSADVKLKNYLTSVTPNNQKQYISARKASEVYPRVPFYIPGTGETGEFWVEPFVTDKGEQRFKFHFIDPKAVNEPKRETMEMDRNELAQIQQGLFKLYEWSNKAQDEKIRKIFSKRSVCFPTTDCPNDGEKGELGKSSIEVRFQIYEDGSTAGRIQRNKGRFEEGYNLSIDSAMLLQGYAAFVLKESDFDFKQGTQSKEDLDKMFQ